MLRIVPLLTVALLAAPALPPLIEGEKVIPLKVTADNRMEPYGKVFGVPVACNGHEATFTWNCGGSTRFSESFAALCGLKVVRDPNNPLQGPKSMFIGEAQATLFFADQPFQITVLVQSDATCQTSERAGRIGHDIARRFQWTMDPQNMKLTLRKPGSEPTTKPIATLPLKEEDSIFWINVKVRNVAVDARLLVGATNMQADPMLQRKWDLARGSELPLEIRNVGPVRYLALKGNDTVELAPGIAESDLNVVMVGDPAHPEKGPLRASGIGANVLNRFVYCVDPAKKQLMILSKVSKPPTQPAKGQPTTKAAKQNHPSETD